jgi:hypothetical protein
LQNESILLNDESRNEIYNDLLVVKEYLDQRIIEINQPNTQDILNLLGSDLPVESLNDLKRYLEQINKIIEIFNNNRFRELILIKSSKKYTERKIFYFKTTTDTINNLEKNIYNAENKFKEIENLSTLLQPNIQELVLKIKDKQNFLQNEISKLLNGRKVNIFGEINKI